MFRELKDVFIRSRATLAADLASATGLMGMLVLSLHMPLLF